jgi:hypothetical protein
MTDDERLDLLKWHIARYDNLRVSTSNRASVLLSGNAIILTGTALLAGVVLDRHTGEYSSVPVYLVGGGALVTLAFTVISVMSCVGAIAARRTIRAKGHRDISLRHLFNWGDTIRAAGNFPALLDYVKSMTTEQAIESAAAELWTDILQHAGRHKYLRRGLASFRYSVIAFLALIALAAFALQ